MNFGDGIAKVMGYFGIIKFIFAFLSGIIYETEFTIGFQDFLINSGFVLKKS